MTPKEIWKKLRESGTGESKLIALGAVIDAGGHGLTARKFCVLAAKSPDVPPGTLAKIVEFGDLRGDLGAMAEESYEFRRALPGVRECLDPPQQERSLTGLSDEDAFAKASKLGRAEAEARDGQKALAEATLEAEDEGFPDPDRAAQAGENKSARHDRPHGGGKK